MRRILVTIVLLIIGAFSILLLHPMSAQAQSERRIVKVGVYENPPKVFAQNGEYTGIFPDILNYIANQERWQIEYVPGSFSDGLNRLSAGEIDIMVDVALDEERAQQYLFTQEPVLGSWGVVYVKSGSEIRSLQDLDGKQVALLESSVYFDGPAGINQYISTFDLNVNFVELPEYGEVFSQLAFGQVDAAVVSRISGQTAEINYPDIHATEIIFSPTKLYFALDKDDEDSLYTAERLDHWVAQLRKNHDSIYYQILSRHNLVSQVQEVEIIPSWVLPALAIVLAITVVSITIAGTARRARQRALQDLSLKEGYLNHLITNLPLIFSTLDENGLITFAAGKSLADLGLNQDKLVGTSILELYKDNQAVVSNIRRALAGQERQYQAQVDQRTFRILAKPVLQNGVVTQVLVVAIDITKEHRLEEVKSEFLTMVQHQLRTPPGAIRWGIELLSPKVIPILDNNEQKMWRLLETNAVRMINLANSFSLVSETESGLLRLKIERFLLPELSEELLKEFADIIAERNLNINKNFGGSAEITHDRIITTTILRVLLSNAIHYSNPGSTVTIKVEEAENHWTIQATNQGPGIPEVYQEKVFERFFRGELGAKMNADGLGIGLYLVKILLDQVGGKIWYRSEPGKETTFFVQLPKTSVPVHSEQV